MRGLVYMASRETFHKGIQYEYELEKLGKSKFGFERTAVSNFKSKRHEGSGNEIGAFVDRLSSIYSVALILRSRCRWKVFVYKVFRDRRDITRDNLGWFLSHGYGRESQTLFRDKTFQAAK